MRDERCAETIQRLLDDLDDLLLSRKAGDRGGNLAENLEEKVRGGEPGYGGLTPGIIERAAGKREFSGWLL